MSEALSFQNILLILIIFSNQLIEKHLGRAIASGQLSPTGGGSLGVSSGASPHLIPLNPRCASLRLPKMGRCKRHENLAMREGFYMCQSTTVRQGCSIELSGNNLLSRFRLERHSDAGSNLEPKVLCVQRLDGSRCGF